MNARVKDEMASEALLRRDKIKRFGIVTKNKEELTKVDLLTRNLTLSSLSLNLTPTLSSLTLTLTLIFLT